MEIPQLDWQSCFDAINWRQGEHVTLVGPTGQGKTTLATKLLQKRAWTMVMATKKRDETLQQFKGYHKTEYPQDWQRRCIVTLRKWPKDPAKLQEAQRNLFRRALILPYQVGNWCVYCDEVRYLSDDLKLSQELKLLWLQGRSLGVSLVVATQRPRHIPLEAYDMATHLFFWGDSDINNVRRIAEIGGRLDRQVIMDTVLQLPKYHFLYVNTRTDEVFQSKVEL